MHVYEDNTKSIGRTPLVRINRLDASSGATVLAKIEGRNPAYSVKCRIGAAMVWDAERARRIEAGNDPRRAHQRQYGHRPGLRGRGAGYKLRSDHAGDHEHGTPQAYCVDDRRRARADARAKAA